MSYEYKLVNVHAQNIKWTCEEVGFMQYEIVAICLRESDGCELFFGRVIVFPRAAKEPIEFEANTRECGLRAVREWTMLLKVQIDLAFFWVWDALQERRDGIWPIADTSSLAWRIAQLEDHDRRMGWKEYLDTPPGPA